jgi:hypothetical protein
MLAGMGSGHCVQHCGGCVAGKGNGPLGGGNGFNFNSATQSWRLKLQAASLPG